MLIKIIDIIFVVPKKTKKKTMCIVLPVLNVPIKMS